MSLPSTRRLLKEYKSGQKADNSLSSESSEDLISIAPVDQDDLFYWAGEIRGSSGTPYEGGTWKIELRIPVSYPIHPPEIKFLTPICHPNIHFKTGEICLDILKTQWTAAWTLQSSCLAIVALLNSPAPDSPLNIDIANVMRLEDNEAKESLIRYFTEKYAMQ
ncbi:ubiquitin-conjugating enzyme/RWD-like protein [Lipomyces oligophaga]|uniref:ubiquitin-conjugating enzyme/RWD-like protein n=1 Tax=Lipomyces oligophaga TaxID=45792 RepID=UPI0034D00D1A